MQGCVYQTASVVTLRNKLETERTFPPFKKKERFVLEILPTGKYRDNNNNNGDVIIVITAADPDSF